MRLQILSDLHLETEAFDAEPAPGAELLVLGGDIDSDWDGLAHFASWPVPVVMVAGNHEFDGRDLDAAEPALRARCEALGITLIERQAHLVTGDDGRTVRILGTTRWSDYDTFGEAKRAKAMRAGGYFMSLMGAERSGRPYDVEAVRTDARACRRWLETALAERPGRAGGADGGRPAWDATVVVTHFAPSLRSADPRYGAQAATASFCNADDDLIPLADLWLHGHLHCAHDYAVPRPDGGTTRVVCNAHGHRLRGETDAHRPHLVVSV